ncbi:MAG TPA: hypothetical protein VJY41_01595 [Prolixibacteraceae bacterium]|nr:hypothetical protein [Prolixibacteraceae bacterium]
MEDQKIMNHLELISRINYLKLEKFKQEEEIINSYKELVVSLNPLSILKESINKRTENRDEKVDLLKIGMNTVANFFINRYWGKNRGIKGLISSALIELISITFINENTSKILLGISKLMRRKPVKEDYY